MGKGWKPQLSSCGAGAGAGCGGLSAELVCFSLLKGKMYQSVFILVVVIVINAAFQCMTVCSSGLIDLQ